MAATTITAVPAGTWQADKTHSSIGFAVRHMVVSTFRGRFTDYDASLTTGDAGVSLEGRVRAESIDIADEQLKGHLLSPDFFDAERTPEIVFDSNAVELEDDGSAVIEGEITIKGHTEPVVGRGRWQHIEADVTGRDRIGLELEAVVDRRAFGLDWNAPLPKGGFALDNDVTLGIHLELVPSA